MVMNIEDVLQNQEIIAYFDVRNEPNYTFRPHPTMEDLRTHTDLIDRLDLIAEKEVGTMTRGYLGGRICYVNAHGIIFAFAASMDFLALRLKPYTNHAHCRGSIVKGLADWVQFDPWNLPSLNPSETLIAFDIWLDRMRNCFALALAYADDTK
jgi:hypothetical protein